MNKKEAIALMVNGGKAVIENQAVEYHNGAFKFSNGYPESEVNINGFPTEGWENFEDCDIYYVLKSFYWSLYIRKEVINHLNFLEVVNLQESELMALSDYIVKKGEGVYKNRYNWTAPPIYERIIKIFPKEF